MPRSTATAAILELILAALPDYGWTDPRGGCDRFSPLQGALLATSLLSGGLGIFLVRKIMDEVEYRREAEKNIFIMKKQIPAGRPNKAERDGDR